MKLAYQYMAIFFNFSPTSNHQRLVVDEDDNGKFRLERVNWKMAQQWRPKLGML